MCQFFILLWILNFRKLLTGAQALSPSPLGSSSLSFHWMQTGNAETHNKWGGLRTLGIQLQSSTRVINCPVAIWTQQSTPVLSCLGEELGRREVLTANPAFMAGRPQLGTVHLLREAKGQPLTFGTFLILCTILRQHGQICHIKQLGGCDLIFTYLYVCVFYNSLRGISLN